MPFKFAFSLPASAFWVTSLAFAAVFKAASSRSAFAARASASATRASDPPDLLDDLLDDLWWCSRSGIVSGEEGHFWPRSAALTWRAHARHA